MHTKEERTKAVMLFIECGFNHAVVKSTLGYPTRQTLDRWYDDYLDKGSIKEKREHWEKYTEVEKAKAIEACIANDFLRLMHPRPTSRASVAAHTTCACDTLRHVCQQRPTPHAPTRPTQHAPAAPHTARANNTSPHTRALRLMRPRRLTPRAHVRPTPSPSPQEARWKPSPEQTRAPCQ